MAGDAVVGALRVVLGLDTGAYEDGVKNAASATESFGKKITEIAAGIQLQKFFDQVTSALISNVAGAIELGNALANLSQKTLIPVETLSALKYAADISGVGLKGLSDTLSTLGKNVTEATGKPMSQAANAFRAIGVTSEELKKPLDEVLTIGLDRLSKFRESTTKTRAEMILLGDAGTKIAEKVKSGGGLKALADEAQQLGVVMSQQTAEDARKLTDTMIRLNAAKDAVFLTITAKLTPSLNKLGDALTSSAKQGGFWERQAASLDDWILKTSEDVDRMTNFWEFLKGVWKDFVSASNLKFLQETLDNISQAFRNMKQAVSDLIDKLPTAPFKAMADTAATAWNFIKDKTLSAVNAVSSKTGELATSTADVAKQWSDILIPGAEMQSLLDKIAARTATLVKANQDAKNSYTPITLAVEDAIKSFSTYRDAAITGLGNAQADVNAKVLAGKDAFDRFIESQTRANAATKADAESMRLAAGQREAMRVIMQAEAVQKDGLIVLDEKQKKARDDLVESTRKFNAALAASQLEVANLTPWEAYNDTLRKNQALMDEFPKKAEFAARANEKAAYQMQAAYGQTAVTIASGFADAFKFIAQENKKYAPIAKALAIATAIAQTFVAANTAMANAVGLPLPLQLAAGAAVVAAGLANVVKISMTDFATGGSFKVGGAGGIDSQMISFRASPGEMVDVRKPGSTGTSSEITVRGISSRDFFTGDMLRSMVEGLNSAYQDGYKLKFAGT